MTWTLKADMLLGVNEPARSIDINAIYDNVEAMCNGDANAPKIQPIAFDPSVTLILPPVSGTSFLQKKMGVNDGAASGISLVKIDEFGLLGTVAATFTALQTGVVTYAFSSVVTEPALTFTIATYKNGVQQTTDVVTSAPFSLTQDITVTKGDVIYATIDGGASGNTALTTFSILTGNDVICGA